MKKITIDFFNSEKIDEELQKLEEKLKHAYISHTSKYSVELFIDGELSSVFAYYLDDGINISIYSENTYYDKKERTVKHITEEIRINKIRSYTIWQ